MKGLLTLLLIGLSIFVKYHKKKDEKSNNNEEYESTRSMSERRKNINLSELDLEAKRFETKKFETKAHNQKSHENEYVNSIKDNKKKSYGLADKFLGGLGSIVASLEEGKIENADFFRGESKETVHDKQKTSEKPLKAKANMAKVRPIKKSESKKTLSAEEEAEVEKLIHDIERNNLSIHAESEKEEHFMDEVERLMIIGPDTDIHGERDFDVEAMKLIDTVNVEYMQDITSSYVNQLGA